MFPFFVLRVSDKNAMPYAGVMSFTGISDHFQDLSFQARSRIMYAQRLQFDSPRGTRALTRRAVSRAGRFRLSALDGIFEQIKADGVMLPGG